jgi:membrane protein involved in D-alanine export
MTPYANLSYFVLIGCILLPMMLTAWLRGRVGGGWIIGATLLFLVIQYTNLLSVGTGGAVQISPGVWVPQLVPLIGFGLYEWVLVSAALRKGKQSSLWLIPAGLLPLVVAKYLLPVGFPEHAFGFDGISYATFRVLDILFAISDGVLTHLGALDFAVFAFFFPTLSSGPIDRFRRFKDGWRRERSFAEFLQDIDASVPFIMRGLLYKMVFAVLLDDQLKHHAAVAHGIHGVFHYSYVYTLYLFFDFAGYSAFAVGVSRCFGIKTPENFNHPFWAANIRDFWNRWHISLSTWFRDHVYSRFLVLAMKRKWIKKRETLAATGYFVSFGLMGLWHGLAPHYLIYGLYHATLLAGYDAFVRWKKRHPTRCNSIAWVWTARLITFHLVCFGMWIFSGHGYLSKPDADNEDVIKAMFGANPL